MYLDQKFWAERYKSGQTGWDIGGVSTPLKEYIDQLENKEIKILIPGCGNAYEADYLFEKGFKNVYIIDIAREPIDLFLTAHQDFPKDQVINADFFELEDEFDLVLEQTFFCALDPVLRLEYVKKMYSILRSKGKLVGVLFNVPLNQDHPPFGGSKEEYQSLFKSHFKKISIHECYNSIKPRMDREVFIKIEK